MARDVNPEDPTDIVIHGDMLDPEFRQEWDKALKSKEVDFRKLKIVAEDMKLPPSYSVYHINKSKWRMGSLFYVEMRILLDSIGVVAEETNPSDWN